jgi:hypothetical protein
VLPSTGSFQQQAQQCITADNCSPAMVQQILASQRKFAQCMRSHGVPNWPDPTIGPGGNPVFNLVPVGITHSETHSGRVLSTINVCGRLYPAPIALESN